MSLAKKLLGLLPGSAHQALLRRAISIRPLEEPGLRFQIAKTRDELEASFSLLHDCYVRIGLMNPHPSGLRCNLHSALPYTTTVIAKKGDRVIGTVSVLKDSPLGFPSDKDYKAENDAYRRQGYRMAEVSALAVHPEYRGDHRISFYLMKYINEYATRYMGCDMFCATVHPRAEAFYAGLLGFRKNGREVQYGFVNDALAIHITLDLMAARREIFPRLYRDSPPKRDLKRFLYDAPAPFEYPSRRLGCVLDPVMTPELLRYFFVERTDVFRRLSSEELSLVHAAYELNFNLDEIPELRGEVHTRRQFRYPMQLEGALLSPARLATGKLVNLSIGGMCFSSKEPLAPGSRFEAIFDVGSQHFRIPAVVLRSEPGSATEEWHHGLRFQVADLRLARSLAAIHHHSQVDQAESLLAA